MILTLDRLVKITAQEVGDRDGERLSEIRRYVKRTVRHIMGLMRKGPVYQTSLLSVSSSTATLPDNVFAVLRIYDTNSITFEQVDNDTYQTRKIGSSTMPSVQVIEDVPNWRLNLLNYGDSTNTLNVDYLINIDDPAALPAYYEDLIVTGAGKRYFMRRDQEKYAVFNSEYTKLENMFKEHQHLNDKATRRVKSIQEVELENPANSLLASGNNGIMNVRGIY